MSPLTITPQMQFHHVVERLNRSIKSKSQYEKLTNQDRKLIIRYQNCGHIIVEDKRTFKNKNRVGFFFYRKPLL
jgi:hypothetical protein